MSEYNIAVFSSSGHESGVTILRNGEVYEVILEERLSRVKRDPILHHVFEPVRKFHQLHCLNEIFFINGTDEEYEQMSICLIKYQLQDVRLTIEPQGHHIYHASSGFYSSGFDNAVCMVIDGIGADHKIDSLLNIGNIDLDEQKINDWSNLKFLENTTIYDVQYPNNFNLLWKNFLVPTPRPENPDEDYPGNFFEIFHNSKIDVNSSYDIGFIYEAVTYHLGFGQENSGKTMGLSAYGKYNKDLPRLIMDNGMANMNVFYGDKFLNTTNHPELRNCNRADLAWSIQKAMEYILILRVKQILKLKPDTKNIVFSGGCAMNICANTVMCEEFPDINFFIDPIAGDAGQSLGAAKYFYHQITQSMKKHPLTSVYHGQRQEITKSQIEYEVAKINNVNYN